jgi:hypothetical protein
MFMDPAKFMVLGVEDRPCYLKAILNKFYVETNATNFYLHQKLHNLPVMIVELNYNVADFNDHTMEIVQNLAMGGHTSKDLLVYLFNAYLKVQDNAFHCFIERRKEAYDDGSLAISHGGRTHGHGTYQVQPDQSSGKLGGQVPRARTDRGAHHSVAESPFQERVQGKG